jgi:hypothetical protein
MNDIPDGQQVVATIATIQHSTRNYEGLSDQFDHLLAKIPHYLLYPEMMAAVGAHFGAAPIRILVLGESHYFDAPEPANVADRWYDRRVLQGPKAARNINTRSVFNNAIFGKHRKKSKAIYRALANALEECGLTAQGATSALQSIAYMNFFQRPAERAGRSILVGSRDVDEANRVLADVVAALEPDMVVFASRLAARHGKKAVASLRGSGIRVTVVPHPACSWWNRPSSRMDGRTGRERFVEAVRNPLERVGVLESEGP